MKYFLIDFSKLTKEEQKTYAEDLVKMVNLELDAQDIYLKLVDKEIEQLEKRYNVSISGVA